MVVARHAARQMLATFICLIVWSGGANADTVRAAKGQLNALTPATVLPQIPVVGCRGGRALLYDECGSQIAIYEAALAQAVAQDKVLLVSYGAEWCIWCHLFATYIHGTHTRFTHTYSDSSDNMRYTSTMYERPTGNPKPSAVKLAKYFADSFVLAHIESRYSPDGAEVLAMSGAQTAYQGGLPFIYSVDAQGRFATSFDYALAETRRDTDDWYRGYDRAKLLKELIRMKVAAQ